METNLIILKKYLKFDYLHNFYNLKLKLQISIYPKFIIYNIKKFEKFKKKNLKNKKIFTTNV